MKYPIHSRMEAAQSLTDEVAALYSIPVEALFGTTRHPRSTSQARHEAVWYVRQLGFSYPELGAFFRRNHTTMIHSFHRACRLRQRLGLQVDLTSEASQ